MVFLDPTNDVAFKKLFGDRAKKDILISFLNAILERSPGERIVDVIINDPSNYPEFHQNSQKTQDLQQPQRSKYSVVDISATDETGKNYIIEMQVDNQEGYGSRAQYYSSVAIARQLKSAESYATITPVIFIGVLLFNLFDDPDYLSHHLVLNNKTLSNGLRLMEWHFVELPKFNKDLHELKNIIDEWSYFLKNIKQCSEMPEQLRHTAELRKAMELLNEAAWSEKELFDYEKTRDTIFSQKGQIALAKAEGLAEGEAKGKAEGEEQKAREVARSMLSKGFDAKLIAELTNLSIEEIKKIKM